MRICTADDCTRKHVAKGMCQKHYVKEQRKSQGREAIAMRPFPCSAGCGETVLRTSTQARRYRPTCSERCKYYVTNGRWPERSTELVGPIPKTCPLPAPARPRELRTRFVGVSCAWCNSTFVQDMRVTGVPIRYCSARCSRARAKADRKGREQGAGGSYTLGEVVRLWLAFGKCCAYCEQPTDGLPDPDHVTPLSRGGSNSTTNILPACRDCNADKWDMTLDEWPADRARRGLPPRRTTWPRGDHRVRHLTPGITTRARWLDRSRAA